MTSTAANKCMILGKKGNCLVKKTNVYATLILECIHGKDLRFSEMFDLNKIIEYPGFTVPVPLGFIDESDSIGMPPIQQHQLKKTLMEDMVAKVSLSSAADFNFFVLSVLTSMQASEVFLTHCFSKCSYTEPHPNSFCVVAHWPLK